MTDNHIEPGAVSTRKPDISYPCTWEYKVIGAEETRLREIITAACAPARPAITFSNVSSGGRYICLNATLRVDSEAMRLAVFNRLQNNPEVRMVI